LAAAGRGRAEQLPLGVGDDACLLPAIGHPVLTTDTQREGVHFHSHWLQPEEIGQRAVEITFSDLAASYAQPAALLVNLALPPAMAQETAERIYRGIGRALERHDCPLAGGNTSRAQRLALDLFAVGRGHADLFPRRDAARPGDGLYASGPLGLARAGLLCLQARCTRFPVMVRRFKFPQARFDTAHRLAAAGVRCVMDISDGLAGDAAHLARASNVSIRLVVAPEDLEPEMVRCCRALGIDALETAIRGGEDYELLFACRPEVFEKLRRLLPGARQVGRVEPRGDRLLLDLPEGWRSFQHGAKTGRGDAKPAILRRPY
jgi:thiamine-monophosphate kinase